MNEAKPFCISKKEVWEAYKRVKANKGAAGVDDQTIEDFEKRGGRSAQRSESHPLKTHRTVHPRTPSETVAWGST